MIGAGAARLSGAADLAATLQGIAAAARSALGADRATCYEHDAGQVVTAVHTTEPEPGQRAFLERALGLGPAELPILRLQHAQADPLLVVEDVCRHPEIPPRLAARLGSGAFLGLRLEHASVQAGGAPALLGTLFCSYDEPRRFTAAECSAARGLANLAALALANAHMQVQTAKASEIIHHERDYSAALVASMQDGLTVLSPEGVVVEVSPRFCQMTGFTRDELIGRGWPYPYWPEAEPERLERAFRRIRETDGAEWDLEFRRKSGERFPVIVGASLLRGQDGGVAGYLSTVKDITERKRAEEDVQRSAAANRVLAAEQAALRRVATEVAAEAAPEAVFARAAEEVARLLGVEAAIVTRFAAEGATVVGTHGGHCALGEHFPTDWDGVLAMVAHTGTPAAIDDYWALAPGSPLRAHARAHGYRASVAAPVTVAGRLWGAVVATTSHEGGLPFGALERLERFAELVALVIANTEARERLAAQAASDPLTGLANHRAFFERLHADVERVRRHGGSLSLVVIDLDLFKHVNDTHGHQTGDHVLVEVAERLSALTRAEDTLARIGGEEFAWLLPECDAAAAWAVAERARRAIAAVPFPAAGRMTMSAGVAELAAGGSVTELFRAADAALYWAKTQGRNACVPFAPEHERAMAARPSGASARLAPSVERLLALTREGLGLTLAVVGEFEGDKEVWRYLDGDGAAFGICSGGEIPLEETYCHRVARGGLPNLIRDARRHEGARDLPITASAGIGAYVGVPITMPDGGLYGMLCCLSPRAELALGERDLRLVRMVASLIGEELEREDRVGRARHRDRERILRVLEGDGLGVVLQPIVELAGGRVVAAEALSRFDAAPHRPPDAWFAEAEAVGLGVELELAAVRAALKHVDALPPDARLSLNVSAAALLAPELIAALAAVPGERLALELTEHAPVDDYPALEEALAVLRGRGVQLMIDDAGAGFASLRHVLGLHPDVIKLDLSLTRDIDSDLVRRALAASLVAFARQIGATIVAEGIETQDELEALRALGVTHGQGYFLARPGAGPVPERVALGAAPALATAR